MHPFLHLVAKEPGLLAEHAEAYVDLIGEEIGNASSRLKRRAALLSVALCGAGVGVVLAGVALMFWAAIPVTNMSAPWALIVVPVAPLVLAVVCVVAAQTKPTEKSFDQIRRQLREDMAMLREVNAP